MGKRLGEEGREGERWSEDHITVCTRLAACVEMVLRLRVRCSGGKRLGGKGREGGRWSEDHITVCTRLVTCVEMVFRQG